MKQPLGQWRGHQCKGVGGTCRFSKERNVAGIAAKGCNIIACPTEGGNRVEGAVVAGVVQRITIGKGRVREPTQRSKPIVDGDHHHIFLGCQRIATVAAPVTNAVTAAVQPQHNRQVLSISRSPHV